MIKGLTDQVQLRRDGKIRAGKKNAQGYPENSPHFLLHDAEQLVPALGPKPTEIYFTVPSDDLQRFYRDDLRLYNKNELVCRSMHDFIDPKDGKKMGSVAAFMKVGVDAAGLRKEQFPGIARAFVRNCAYKACPDYIKGDCGEHMFLDMIIPQYSMGALFTLDSVSINAILNAMSTFSKAHGRYQGKLAGQIFKLFKKKDSINFPDKSGNLSRRETDVVDVANVSFAEYEAKFKDSIDPIDWEALLFIRNRPVSAAGFGQIQSATTLQLEASGDYEVEEVTQAQIAAPQSPLAKVEAQAQTDAERAKAIGNDPSIAKFFAEIALLMGKENTEDARTKTAMAYPSVERLGEYLSMKIKEFKKNQKAAKGAQAIKAPPKADVIEAKPVTTAPAQPLGPTVEGNPLF